MQQRLLFSRLNDEEKIKILEDIDARIGGDINDLSNVYLVENDLVTRRNHLEKSLNLANNEGPIILGTAIRRAEKSSKEIERLKEKNKNLRVRIEQFMTKTEPLREGLNERFSALGKLEQTLLYLKSYEKVDDLSVQLKQSTDDEQAVTVYTELKSMCLQYTQGHRSSYVKENTRYWHNVLRDKFSKQYEEIMKLLKWPLSSNQENSPTPKEIMIKFNNLTRYLLLIKEPDDIITSCVTGDFSPEQAPCLPVRILLRPLKKRFTFHFTGSRQTARIDRPEWFLTQTLTWIKDHQTFMRVNLQPVIDKLQMLQIRAEDEFNAGLIALAAERLHTVLSLYHAQSKGDVIDEDAAFAHAVDETLGFHKELVTLTGKDVNGVLSVLTKAEIFVRWLALEKKYALAKMESCLSSPSWMDGVARAGVAAAVPRGADWLVSLLKTVEERYAVLPQPGHRLQFLELQLELIEEWRVRLTQLLSASLSALTEDTFLQADDSPHTLTAVINAAHHTRGVLMQWAHSLHYLQLHYYRRQFQHFTQQQHDAPPLSEDAEAEREEYTDARERGMEKSMSLDEVEERATRLALNEASSTNSLSPEDSQQDLVTFEYLAWLDKARSHGTSPLINPALLNSPAPDSLGEESGVFGEAPALLAHLRDAGLTALADHILMEFKAALRDYRRQKWHAMPPAEEMSLSLSPSLCRALGGLYSRLLSIAAKLAPALYTRTRPTLARHIDRHVFEEVVLSSWWNAGGTIQFTHDVKRNLLPALAPPQKLASTTNHLPLLMEACQLLNMDYEDARRLHQTLLRQRSVAQQTLESLSILHISCADAAALLGRRTDLMETTPPSLADLF